MAIKFVECSHVNFKNCAVFSILIKTPDANRLRACENHLIIEIIRYNFQYESHNQ